MRLWHFSERQGDQFALATRLVGGRPSHVGENVEISTFLRNIEADVR
jgi:hypothetical protein